MLKVKNKTKRRTANIILIVPLKIKKEDEWVATND